MDAREQILSLIKKYANKECNTKFFCDSFITLYYYETSGYLSFNEKEREILANLASVAERFTIYEDDIKEYPMFYVTEDKVLHELEKVVDTILP